MSALRHSATACAFLTVLAVGVGCTGRSSEQAQVAEAGHGPPNVLLIVADDMGYTDVGAYGGEIPTPRIDALATEGVMLTQFHATPNCAPTRAALLTGVDYHRTGLGSMGELITDNQRGEPGYEGHLNDRVVTVAELLRDKGYRTWMAGKWHLGAQPGQRPFSRGFDDTFVLLAGGASHWSDNTPLTPGKPSPYSVNGELLNALPEDFYSTTAYADRTIEWLQSTGGDDRPFLAYLAFTAPHNPLHAPAEAIARFRGRYDEGWDVLRERRLRRLHELGLTPASVPVFGRPDWIRGWDELTEDQRESRARDMEIYAAMIEELDAAVGRVVDHLKASGEYDDTLIFFLSDNGASRTTILDYAALGGEMGDFLESFDNTLDNRGLPGSSTDIGPGWAWAASAPFRLMKGYVAQGGMQVPAIVKLPRSTRSAGSRNHAFTHVVDFMPTVLDAAGLSYPTTWEGREIEPLDGRSLLPLLEGGDAEGFANREMGFELYGLRAYRRGSWKALRFPEPYGSGEWQLYDLASDPGDVHDLASEEPERLEELIEAWQAWSKEYGVIEPDRPVGYARTPRAGSF